MKNIFATIFMSFTAIAAMAQIADIVVSYETQSRNWETDSLQTGRMTLLANSRQAKYFNDVSLWNDSLSSTPEGKKQLQQIMMAACMTELPGGGISFDMRKGPVKKVHTYVFTNLADNKLRYYSKFGDSEAYYDEPLDEMKWELGDSAVTVLGYECIPATTDYHGRRWTAWFAPEIPVPFGPWKLHGLPGLILKAEADNGKTLTATGLQKSDRIITPMYSPDNYSKTERKKALDDEEYYRNNREAIIKAKYDGVQFIDNRKEKPKYDAARYADEPDYKQK